MKRITMIVGIALSLAIPQMHLVARGACDLAPGDAEIFYTIEEDSGYLAAPEGIASDWMGNIYVTNRVGMPGGWAVNEVIRISPWGEARVLADLGPAGEGQWGILGLTTDWFGNVYAAFPSGNENHGVWKIDRRGRTKRLSGSENIAVPNDLVFDWCGNLYVTDSYPKTLDDPGVVWKYGNRSRHFVKWSMSHFLAPYPDIDPHPFPAPGANGIAFVPPNNLYVANNEKSTILHIPILNNGTSGEVTVIAGPGGPPGLLFAPDGLAADVEGNLYAAIPPAGFTGDWHLSPVIKITPPKGENEAVIEAVVEPLLGPSTLFDFQTSLTFGGWFTGRKCLYVVSNSAIAFGIPGGSGPKVTKVGVGVRGLPLQ